jgi:hypothetical protein
MRSTTITLALATAAVLAACGKGADASPSVNAQDVAPFVGKSTSDGSSATDVQPGVAATTQGDVDPCTFFSKAEIEKAFGARFGPPKKKDNPFAGPMCLLPGTTTGAISIRAGEAVGRAQFDSLPMMLREHAERLSGLGESAFLYNTTLYVFNNGRQLVVSASGAMTPQLRAALLTLGRLGAPRLRR